MTVMTDLTLNLPGHLDCQACMLRTHRINVVPGRGNLTSPLVFVGEAPGADEDRVGKPFVGASGKLLRNIIDSMPQMAAAAYFYTNIYHCRPPGNKVDAIVPGARTLCPSMWLRAEMLRINPKVIVAVGKTACDFFRPNDTDMPMRWHAAKDHYDEERKCWVIGMFHPAYALRMGVSEGKHDGNVAIVSMVHSLQRAMYYLAAHGYMGETPPDIIDAMSEGSIG